MCDDANEWYGYAMRPLKDETLICVIVKSKAVPNTKTVMLPKRCREKSDHTHIVEMMQDSRDLAGPVEFCFWSLNGQPCQCGKC
jgi:hypothetical protein